MSNDRRRRGILNRQIVVNPPVQYIFVYYSFFVGAIFFTAGSATTAILLKFMAAGQANLSMLTKSELLTLSMLLLLVIASILFGLELSNRIAGPIFRLLQELKKIHNVSEMNEIVLRKHDFFHEVAKSYNDVLKQLRDQDLDRDQSRDPNRDPKNK